MKYTFRGHVGSTITVFEKNEDGTVKVVPVDKEVIARVNETNQKSERDYNAAMAGRKQGSPKVFRRARVPMPVAQPVVKEVISLENGGVYELDDQDDHVKSLVVLGLLVKCEDAPMVAAPVAEETASTELVKGDKAKKADKKEVPVVEDKKVEPAGDGFAAVRAAGPDHFS